MSSPSFFRRSSQVICQPRDVMYAMVFAYSSLSDSLSMLNRRTRQVHAVTGSSSFNRRGSSFVNRCPSYQSLNAPLVSSLSFCPTVNG